MPSGVSLAFANDPLCRRPATRLVFCLLTIFPNMAMQG
jgi:hypothetical protein